MTAGRIDVHAHFVPEEYRRAAVAAGHVQPDGFPALPQWSPEEHLAMLDRSGIGMAMLSVSSPGVHFGDDSAARLLARSVNDTAASLVERHPSRFGHFASLPLPDVDGTLAEIDHVFDTLGADGVTVLTNAGGVYLGDPSLEPVFAELDRRHARVFIHPTSPACWECTSLGRPRPMIEFLFDTTRAVVNLVLNGVVARYENLEIVVPHAGATLAMIVDRVAAISAMLPDVDAAIDVKLDLAGLHYDLAGFPVSRQLDALLTVTTLDRLHYGSDYPFTPEAGAARLAQLLDGVSVAPGPIAAALTANSRQLFPAAAARMNQAS